MNAELAPIVSFWPFEAEKHNKKTKKKKSVDIVGKQLRYNKYMSWPVSKKGSKIKFEIVVE